MYIRTDIFVGPVYVYVDNKNIGWTRGGVRLRVNKSLWGRPSLFGLGVSEIIKQSEDFYIQTVFVESTLANLRKAWGINEGESVGKIYFGGSTTVPVHSLKFVARNRTLQVGFYKVVAVDFGELSYNSKSDAAIPVTFRALLDTSKTIGSQVGYMIQGNATDEKELVCKVTTIAILGHSNLICRVTNY